MRAELIRLPGWDVRLHSLIDERRGDPFAWGTRDCAIFASDAILAMTGTDPMTGLRGRYRTRAGARRLLPAYRGISTWMTDTFGEGVTIGHARRGDLLLLDGNQDQGQLAGICLGQFAIAQGLEGLVQLSLDHAACAWRIG